MGTNFYHIENPCPTCGHGRKRHIGKSSGGWPFSLHVYPEDDILDFPDWKRVWTEGEIRNEYNDLIPSSELLDIITNREFELRHEIDGCHCVGNGDGSWDIMIGDFC